MRYTTIIDISEMTDLYRNLNTRAVYLHLVLKSGYHDDDRDKIRISIRRLAAESGLTVSAVRNALQQLEKASMIERTSDGATIVRKWILETKPTARTKATTTVSGSDYDKRMEEYERERKERLNVLLQVLEEMSLDDVRQWQKELSEGVSKRHHGQQINANQDNVKWLQKWIDKKMKKS